MEKSATLNLRVNPELKEQAEQVLKQLGIPMSTAIDMYLNQIAQVGGIPFPLRVSKSHPAVNADLMSPGEIADKLRKGMKDAKEGRTHDAEALFSSDNKEQAS